MSDLISRQAAIDAMESINDGICEQQAIDALCELPSAQPEIIRCKDCKHYVNDEHYGMMCEILVHAEQGDDFYCGYGQKKPEQEKWDV